MSKETVVNLSKRSIDAKKLKLSLLWRIWRLYLFAKKATYEQIKKYVLEQNGMKVSTLYISQVKRKCGLEVGENYNKAKNEESKVPQCPVEKEEAIYIIIDDIHVMKVIKK